MKEFSFNTLLSLSFTVATAWLGGWDAALKMLCAFMVIDYITGVLGAIKTKKLNSETMFWGGIRKGAILIVIGIAVMFDELIGNQDPIFRTLAIYYYIAREGLSVTENLGIMGVSLPPFVVTVLEQLRERGGETIVRVSPTDNGVAVQAKTQQADVKLEIENKEQ